jgi:hypothetical protein
MQHMPIADIQLSAAKGLDLGIGHPTLAHPDTPVDLLAAIP